MTGAGVRRVLGDAARARPHDHDPPLRHRPVHRSGGRGPDLAAGRGHLRAGWTETAVIAQRAVDRSGLPELLAGQGARSPKRWSEETARFVRELPGVVRIKVWDP